MWISFSGIFGLVVFLFGFVASLLLQGFNNPFLVLHMLTGIIFMLLWFFAYGLKNMSQAGEVLKGRSMRYGANAILYCLVFTGFLLLVYYLAKTYDKRWDLTESGVYSLAPQSVSVIEKLNEPLKIIAFKGIANIDEDALKRQLDLYAKHNAKFVDTQLIDVRTRPHVLDQYDMKTGNLIYLQYGSGEKISVSRLNESSEQAITNAIIKLTRGAARKIYYVIGHGQPDLKSDDAAGLSALAAAIGDEHLTVETILLSQSAELPDDTAAVILNSPKRPMLPEEIELLKQYVENGGRLLMFADPRTADSVRELAAYFNIKIGDDVIIDQIQRLFAAPALGAQPIVREYTPHAITRNLKADDITVYNIASSVVPARAAEADEIFTELAKTAATAWAEKNLEALFDQADPTAVFDQGTDTPGPISLAVAYEKKLDLDSQDGDGEGFEKRSRLVVFGDSDWILNANLPVYSNRDFVLSSINWLVGEEGGISIGRRDMRMSDAPMTREDFLLLLTASFVIPEIILLLGLFIWWRRKHAYGV